MFSSDFTHNYWIDAFQVRRVSEYLNRHLSAIRISTSEMSTHMILHISRSFVPVRLLVFSWDRTVKFCENLFERLADDVSEHVQTTSVRHTNNTFVSSELAESVNATFHSRDERLHTFKSEPLISVEFLL